MQTENDSNIYQTLEDFDRNDEPTVVATVRMLIENHVNEEKVILVVEGSDDKDVFGSFVSSSTVEIYADGNCDKHAVILSLLNSAYSERLLAIKDADFDVLNGNTYPYDNLLLTDAHDLEGMILENGIPQDVIDAYPERLRDYDLDSIHGILECVSYLKWFNSKQSARLKFKGLKWSNFYDGTNAIELEAYFDAAKNNTNNVIKWTLDDVLNFKSSVDAPDSKQLYRGHDMFECLYIKAKSVVPNVNFKKSKFFRSMKGSYKLATFQTTQLCESMMRWAEKYDRIIFSQDELK